MSEPVKAWYFCGDDRKLRYGDGRAIVDGETLTVDCEPILCKQGLHASVKLSDALSYAPGLVLCRVEVSGNVVTSDDKIAGTARKVVWSLPSEVVSKIVVQYAKWCSERAAKHAASYAVNADNAVAAAYYAANYAAHYANAADYAAYAANAAANAAYYAKAAYNAANAADYAANAAANAAYYAANARRMERDLQEEWLLAAVRAELPEEATL